MSAIITDQFRLFNAENFVDSVNNNDNSYYVFLGLSNPTKSNSFGRSTGWNSNPDEPVDNLQYVSHYKDTLLFGKKIISSNVRRIVRKVTWTENNKYEMYRHDYSTTNLAPISELPRLYDCDYYVMNSDYRVYICIDNGSSVTNPKGNKSQDQPTFTDEDPSAAGSSGDGYVWKYLFTILPSDIIKFDSTEYIVLPNNWDDTSTNSEIKRIRDAGNSDVEENQIQKIYIANAGSSYLSRDEEYSVDINGDGTGATASIKVTDGKIVSARVTSGGKGYTYGIVDLGQLRAGTIQEDAQLVVIIPPSKGHGYDIYKELGADRVLIYARFDDLTEDTPISTAFAQIGILKNPKYNTADTLFEENQFSSLYAIKLSSIGQIPIIGEQIRQVRESDEKIAKGYVASYDSNTGVLKYFRDRSLYFPNGEDETDDTDISDVSEVLDFESSSANQIQFVDSAFSAPIDTTFDENKVIKDGKIINLGVTFSNGLSNPEINKKTGDIIYIDNRPLVTRNLRQKEDVKIILEF
jgi:hypothetical protein